MSPYPHKPAQRGLPWSSSRSGISQQKSPQDHRHPWRAGRGRGKGRDRRSDSDDRERCDPVRRGGGGGRGRAARDKVTWNTNKD